MTFFGRHSKATNELDIVVVIVIPILKYFCVTISNKYTDQIIAVESYLHF